ncbi:unnamed protein product [Penicillium roqueforti FM164]|uniref:Genomic scaffold, ProqFM164S04 n=1 Tax=Penicillium roqueforti (strain FM164) TaxID=1365484 RepID=W6QG51_PENRF|nr:unnamed protein product [Penicillium roqueforti FM164]
MRLGSGNLCNPLRDQHDRRSFRERGLEHERRWKKGREHVYRVNSYHVPTNDKVLVRNFKKCMPNHQPIWTCVE